MAKNSKAKIKANNKYTAKAYDRLNIVIPKGQKAAVEAAAKATAGGSINGYVNRLIRENLGLSEDEWKNMEKE